MDERFLNPITWAQEHANREANTKTRCISRPYRVIERAPLPHREEERQNVNAFIYPKGYHQHGLHSLRAGESHHFEALAKRVPLLLDLVTGGLAQLRREPKRSPAAALDYVEGA